MWIIASADAKVIGQLIFVAPYIFIFAAYLLSVSYCKAASRKGNALQTNPPFVSHSNSVKFRIRRLIILFIALLPTSTIVLRAIVLDQLFGLIVGLHLICFQLLVTFLRLRWHLATSGSLYCEIQLIFGAALIGIGAGMPLTLISYLVFGNYWPLPP